MRGMPGGGNMGQMMKQLQKMQRDMEETQAKVETETFEASAGGGAIKVTCSGKRQILSVELKPEIVDADDIEMLQDLIITATNDALDKAEEAMTKAMSKFSQIPGMF